MSLLIATLLVLFSFLFLGCSSDSTGGILPVEDPAETPVQDPPRGLQRPYFVGQGPDDEGGDDERRERCRRPRPRHRGK